MKIFSSSKPGSSVPPARLSVLQCYNMGHNGHGINLYGVIMILIGNLHAGGQSSLGHLSLLHRCNRLRCPLAR